jgi:gamma-glutamyl:cysteine ligase YbdK (ATP-grasp superfamily)
MLFDTACLLWLFNSTTRPVKYYTNNNITQETIIIHKVMSRCTPSSNKKSAMDSSLAPTWNLTSGPVMMGTCILSHTNIGRRWEKVKEQNIYHSLAHSLNHSLTHTTILSTHIHIKKNITCDNASPKVLYHDESVYPHLVAYSPTMTSPLSSYPPL